ncbi:MAG TPA: septum formation initiator family protein [Woeseiaceae bacterium]
MRWLLIVLIMSSVALQGQLWLSDDGIRKTQDLQAAVQDQKAENNRLRLRNASLEAEVINLKQGRTAAEERARTDLGMIGRKETFFQVVPRSAKL